MSVTEIRQLVNWFRVHNEAQVRQDGATEKLTLEQVMALLYYVQGMHLAVFDTVAFADDILACERGVAIQTVATQFYGAAGLIDDLDEAVVADHDAIEADPQLAAIVHMVQAFADGRSIIRLITRMSTERPWMETPQNQVILPGLMADYFRKLMQVIE